MLGLALAFFLYRLESFHSLLLSLGELGYIGAFIAGMLFVVSFTAVSGAIILLVLAEQLNPAYLALIAGAGAVAGDLFIFRFVKDELFNEVLPIFNKFGGKHLKVIFHTKYFSWSLPVIGALIIASPLPDEIGVSLIGLSRMSTLSFLSLSFFLNSLGIFIVLTISTVVKP